VAFARRHGFDLLIVIAALAAALEVALKPDSALAPSVTRWFCVPAAAVLVLPLLARRRRPFAAPAAVWLLAAGVSFVDGHLIEFSAAIAAAGLAASCLLGQLADVRQERIGLAVVLGSAAIIVSNDPGHAAGDLLFIPAFFGLAWLAGFALRGRSAQAVAAEERARVAEREARIAVAEERARIARELHDIVAHSVSVIVLQVGAVRHNLPADRGDDREALMAVERTGRTALSEMRHLLGALRREDEDVELAPQPGLASLDALLEAFRRAGLPVRLTVAGEPVELPRTLDLSAYRIVQEGLTNALKHARASRADVDVAYVGDELRIAVRDDGSGDGDGAGDRLGHGLIGIRERVKIYGGSMTAGTLAEGGFGLTTTLPLR
jgi:signal transduction histidine kinase